MTYYIYEVAGEKIGATKNWNNRQFANRSKYGQDIIITIVETMEGPDTEEFWQVVGDREWELADQYGYDRGEHYLTALQKLEGNRVKFNSETGRAAALKVRNFVNRGKTKSTWLHTLTHDEVINIRAKYIPRKYSQSRLAKEYNVSQGTIYRIVNNLIYTDIK